MKKAILAVLAIMIIAMFVAGCSQERVTSPDEKEPVQKAAPKETVKEEIKTTEPAPEAEPEPEPEPVKQMSKKMTELLTKHTRVTSMNYVYQDAINYPMEWPTWVEGNRVTMDVRDLEEVGNDVFINKIYLNTASKTAKGYCEKSVYRCKDPNEAVDLKYAKYIRKTPLDWIKEVTYAEKEAEETRQQRLAWKIVYEDEDGNEVAMWVDEYYGVPMEVHVKKGSSTKKYIYEDLSINGVDDEDLEHQMITTTYN